MTELEAEDLVTRYANVWQAGISDDFQTVWRVRDDKIIGKTVFSDTAPLRAARRGEMSEPMMRFPISAGGAADQEG
jgi:hypothetical protein